MTIAPRALREALVACCACAVAGAALSCAQATRAPAPAAPDPVHLAYTLPVGGRATYAVTDSVRMEADGERVRFAISGGYEALVRLRFRTEGDSLLVQASLTEFEGRLVNPTVGAEHASLDDVDGEWTASVTRTGRVTSIETPILSEAYRRVVGTEDLLRALFVPLPDGPAGVGTEWVDTLRTSDEGAGMGQSAATVARTRVAERTSSDGRPVLVLESVVDTRLTLHSEAHADEPATQELHGQIRRRAVWDAGLRRLVGYRATGRLTGELRVEGMEPIPLTADIAREVVAR